MSKAERYRQDAEASLHLARKVEDQAQRQFLLQTASAWLRKTALLIAAKGETALTAKDR